jgi:hypothetical protein
MRKTGLNIIVPDGDGRILRELRTLAEKDRFYLCLEFIVLFYPELAFSLPEGCIAGE